MPIIGSNPSAAGFFRRDTALKIWDEPAPHEQQDPLIAFRQRSAEITEKLAELDELAAKHVYHNPNFTLLDARQHRMILHYYLYKMEELALDVELLKRPDETATLIATLDEQVQRLQKIFDEWHGDPEGGSDIPNSFKESMRDVKAGRTAEMEPDMFAADASVEA